MPLQALTDTAVFPLILLMLACYRLARFITRDDGPWRLMFRIRVWAGTYDYRENGRPRRMLGQMLECPHCVGLWIALAMAIGLCWTMPWPVVGLIWWAIAGGQSLLESL